MPKRVRRSPKKIQTVLTHFGNKKLNLNSSPKTHLDRSFAAIVQGSSNTSSKKHNRAVEVLVSNNPFAPLAPLTEIDETEPNMGPAVEPRESSTEISGAAATDAETDKDETSSTSTEKTANSTPCRLSRKTINLLKRAKKAADVLKDPSVRDELQAFFQNQADDNTNQDGNASIAGQSQVTGNDNPSPPPLVEPLVDTTSTKNHSVADEHNLAGQQATSSQPIQNPYSRKAHPKASLQSSRTPTVNNRGGRGGGTQPVQPSQTFDPCPIPPGPQSANVGRHQKVPSVDKKISLKRAQSRPHIHRYTLRFRVPKEKDNDDTSSIKMQLQHFFDTVLQADPATIIPPYVELDRNDRAIPDLSATFNVSSIDALPNIKKYFFRMSPKNEEGLIWCRLILAQNFSFPLLMERIRYSLENLDLSLWPNASDNESSTDIGWFLYSHRSQDEGRLAQLLSNLTGENIGVKWKPVRTTGPAKKRDPNDSSDKAYALHLECSTDRIHEARQKLTAMYGSSSTQFPDGTKMRLVPIYTSVFSSNNRGKFASCIARQIALLKGLNTCTTWEMSSNLALDRKDPNTGKSFRQLVMALRHSETQLPLFHTVDKLYRSETGVVFSCRPEHNAEARDIVAGLVPLLRDGGFHWFLKLFSEEAIQRHAFSFWNAEERCIKSAEEAELEQFLAADDELNLTDEPSLNLQKDFSHIANSAPTPVNFPSFQSDDDSVSTFRSSKSSSFGTATTTPSSEPASMEVSTPPSISRTCPSHGDVPITLHEGDTVSKLSDTGSRLSTLEHDIISLGVSFRTTIEELRQQNATQHNRYEAMMEHLVGLLQHTNLPSSPNQHPTPTEAANNPQLANAGGSTGAAGSC